MNDSNSSPNRETGLRPRDPQHTELSNLRERIDELSDAMDLLPLVEGFREQIEEERRDHRRRVMGMSLFFLLLMGGVVTIPILMGKRFTEAAQVQTEAQIASQERLVNKLTESLDAVADLAAGLQRTATLPPTTPVLPRPVPLEKEIKPQVQRHPPATSVHVPTPPLPAANETTQAATPVEQAAVRTALEDLLDGIDRAIEEKQRALENFRQQP